MLLEEITKPRLRDTRTLQGTNQIRINNHNLTKQGPKSNNCVEPQWVTSKSKPKNKEKKRKEHNTSVCEPCYSWFDLFRILTTQELNRRFSINKTESHYF